MAGADGGKPKAENPVHHPADGQCSILSAGVLHGFARRICGGLSADARAQPQRAAHRPVPSAGADGGGCAGGRRGIGQGLWRCRDGFAAPDAHGNEHRAADADARAERLHERHEGIGDVDGGKPRIPHVAPYEERVHHSIKPAEQKCDHRGDHIAEKGLFHCKNFIKIRIFCSSLQKADFFQYFLYNY